MYEREMARTGEKLFKRRQLALYIIVLVGGTLAYMGDGTVTGDVNLDRYYEWFWVAVALGATVFRVMTSGYAARGTSGATREEAKAEVLNTTGPYSIVRNPLYVGRVLIYTSIGFLSGEWVYGVIVFFLSVMHFERIIAYEESFLSGKFGASYLAWGEVTPGFMPRLASWIKPNYSFWWQRAFRRESNKGIALFVTMIVYHVIGGHSATGVWTIDSILLYTLYALIAARLAMIGLVFFTKYFENVD